MTYDTPFSSQAPPYWLQGFNGEALDGYNHGFAMRFVKDAPPPPPPVEFYNNDSQTGTPTTFLQYIRGTSGFGTER